MASGPPRAEHRRLPLALLAAAALVVVVLAAVASGGGGGGRRVTRLPAPTGARLPAAGYPFAYDRARASSYIARAVAGSEHVLFFKSPDGVLATAARVAAFHDQIVAASAGTGIDPALLEGIVFLESAGRPQAIAGGDPAAAAGLTQIVAQTGQSLLGMHIDLAQSRRLTGQIDLAQSHGNGAAVRRLEAKRARIDDRFDPRKALAATVRYLRLSEQRFGRLDLAIESYHMGIGNLQQVLDNYDGGAAVPYVQLFFDTAPDHHPAAYALLSSFGDDSWLYYWRILGAVEVMRLYRTDPGLLGRVARLQTATDSAADLLHPPAQTAVFADPGALLTAYGQRVVVPLPADPARVGLAYDRGIGSLANHLRVPPRLYRGLRPAALDVLLELAKWVKRLSHGAAPLIVTSAVSDARYQQLLGVSDPPAAAGWSFTIARRYVNHGQAAAFQAMLDRLQALDVIAWERFPAEIEVTVAADAPQVLAQGP